MADFNISLRPKMASKPRPAKLLTELYRTLDDIDQHRFELDGADPKDVRARIVGRIQALEAKGHKPLKSAI